MYFQNWIKLNNDHFSQIDRIYPFNSNEQINMPSCISEICYERISNEEQLVENTKQTFIKNVCYFHFSTYSTVLERS